MFSKNVIFSFFFHHFHFLGSSFEFHSPMASVAAREGPPELVRGLAGAEPKPRRDLQSQLDLLEHLRKAETIEKLLLLL